MRQLKAPGSSMALLTSAKALNCQFPDSSAYEKIIYLFKPLFGFLLTCSLLTSKLMCLEHILLF